MGWQERFYDLLAEMLRDQFDTDAVKVTGFEDYTYYGGYCDTCSFSETNCNITYIDSHGYYQQFVYSGSFSDLIAWLDSQTAP